MEKVPGFIPTNSLNSLPVTQNPHKIENKSSLHSNKRKNKFIHTEHVQKLNHNYKENIQKSDQIILDNDIKSLKYNSVQSTYRTDTINCIKTDVVNGSQMETANLDEKEDGELDEIQATISTKKKKRKKSIKQKKGMDDIKVSNSTNTLFEDVDLNNVFNEIPNKPLVKLQTEETKCEDIQRFAMKREAQILKLKKYDCHAWRDFKCNQGDRCTYSHDGPGGSSTSNVLCRFARSDSCLEGVKCIFSHDTKKFPCFFFHSRNNCNLGEHCRFSHDVMTEKQRIQLVREELDYQAYKAKLTTLPV
jgi:hypothetical protein